MQENTTGVTAPTVCFSQRTCYRVFDRKLDSKIVTTRCSLSPNKTSISSVSQDKENFIVITKMYVELREPATTYSAQ